ncbi:hypothetical protein HPMG_01022 [Helicobacter pullorum MIT 98-5489]|uniref:Uncharacterized protein n=1 Tax=Helicobacter pullorum MIT 98-5489 TaxID=537972 RepID=C5EZX1_9HELI|nr:hypothetical protein HPMG_01022 [Helicobacter pullorum MIT 98-5489]
MMLLENNISLGFNSFVEFQGYLCGIIRVCFTRKYQGQYNS